MRARSRMVGTGAALVFATLVFLTAGHDDGLTAGARRFLFDAYHQLQPRARISGPVTIVAVDEASLAALGQWPWPRDRMAALIDAIGAHEPAAIGIDILFAEPDRLSPEALSWTKEVPAETQAWLANRTSNDALMAQAIARHPVALGVAGMETSSPHDTLNAMTPARAQEGFSPEALRPYRSLLRSLPAIDAAAAGRGLLSADPDPDGVIRRVYLAARVGETLVPSLDLEMLRLATGAPWFDIAGNGRGATAVSIGDLRIPVQRDASTWVHFGRHDPARFISASAVLSGTADPSMLESKLVLIGVTGLGLVDQPSTPLAARMAGVEVRAQILETAFDGTWLTRPSWMPMVEALMTLLFGGLLAASVPALRPRYAVLPFAAGLVVMAGAGFAAFAVSRVLVDVLTPALAGAVIFVDLLVTTLAEADQQRRRYKRDLEAQRVREAALAGEVAAARRIQLGSLPDPRTISDARGRIDVAAMLEPARQVGGDLYDLFKVDQDRLFFMIGDVSGKGIPASIFMALGKALYKSAVLRRRQDIAGVMTEANTEISRDNAESMFITAVAAILDLRDGALTYCNAGHDPPLVLKAGSAPQALGGDGGPPLCVLDDTVYPGEAHRLEPGDAVVLYTDGVTEAMNAAQTAYGAARLMKLLGALPPQTSAQGIVSAIYDDVHRHSGGGERSDDIAVVAVIWRGPMEAI